MKTSHRLTLAAFAFTAFNAANAFEISEYTPPKSTLSRAEVQADARPARSAPGELYDGTREDLRMPKATALSREQVRMQARSARTRSDDYTGG